MSIAVTGGSGKLGTTVVSSLRAAGHDVTNFDRTGQRSPGFVQTDLTDYGQVLDALHGVDRAPGFDAVVHLGAIPASALAPDSATFHNNMAATYNVLQGAIRAGIRRIVMASSETLLGIPFDIDPPYAPLDEEYPSRPESTYAIVKHLEEELARKLVRWDAELSITGLRFSNVMTPDDYAQFPDYSKNPSSRRWNLWGYIDARDGAQAVLRALETAKPGFETYVIANADTVVDTPSAELMATFFPDVELTRELTGNETLLSIEKARRELGYEPQFGWRQTP
ncbi:MAG: UDP-glucose 4-epimerase [Leifsonia sp.]|nr:UDP-glucose 4-epimerase [Leifsonia sp.]|tara:strand:+ start:64506 stop:65348 length:843 start_codon:yes stop_codon:yes gene_type:complete